MKPYSVTLTIYHRPAYTGRSPVTFYFFFPNPEPFFLRLHPNKFTD